MARRITDRELLESLQAVVDDSAPPTATLYGQKGAYGARTIIDRFGSWWRGVVQAGFVPPTRRPLTQEELLRFTKGAKGLPRPEGTLVVLLQAFTGLAPKDFDALPGSWFRKLPGGWTVVIPETNVVGTEPWEFVIPERFTVSGERRKTGLPGLLEWYFGRKGELAKGGRFWRRKARRAAAEAGLETSREVTDHQRFGRVPRVTAADLTATCGIQMARQEAPSVRIRRHLGLNRMGRKATVEDYFLWLFVREGIIHPDYEPPDVVLDPLEGPANAKKSN